MPRRVEGRAHGNQSKSVRYPAPSSGESKDLETSVNLRTTRHWQNIHSHLNHSRMVEHEPLTNIGRCPFKRSG
jgi:hypothetical protein